MAFVGQKITTTTAITARLIVAKELNGQRTSTLELLDCCEGCCVVMLCYVSPWYHINQRLTIVQPAAAREEVTGLRNLRDALVR
jgi:hypothetical protein